VQRYASCPNLVSCRGYLKIAQLAYQKELSRPLTYETQQATCEIHQQSWMRRNSRASLQCKVTKSCHRNVMGCEDQNLIKALWRSQAPLQSLCIHLASVWEKRIFVFITIPSYSCVLLPPPLLSRTPSIRYCSLYPPLTYIQEYSQWNITSVLHLGTRRTNSAQNRLLEVLFHFQVLLHSRKVCMQTLRQYVICAMP